jgi:hypothetical protein
MADVMADINARIGTTTGADDYVVELMVAIRRQFRQRAVLGALLFPGRGSPLFDDGLLARATPVTRQFLSPLLQREPRLAARADDVVELFVRMGVSVLLFDSDAVRSDDDLRAFLRRTLVPMLLP